MASVLNYPLLLRFLGTICLLIGASMSFSFPFAFPSMAGRTHVPPATGFEQRGAYGLLASMLVCFGVGLLFRFLGRSCRPGSQLFRKEAMAIVGLSWVCATVLGALPYCFSGTQTAAGMPITFIEAMFESQSGFSTTGATILTDLESPGLVPHCILFWRSWTHFLGGLGIIVLFVAILGQGSAGKAMMRAEMPGPTKDGSMPRMQHTALVFAAIYVGLNIVLTITYFWEGMSAFDALCHAFSTVSTGGFSTYNRSLGGFDSPLIESTTIAFMFLGGTNFTLMYFSLIGRPGRMLRDVEFRAYLGIIGVVTAGVVFFGMRAHDEGFGTLTSAIRNGLFQVVSVITTTGYGTADFDRWNNFGRGILLVLMFVGGCAGSTSGGMKVIRMVLFCKIMRLEVERAHRPRVVRPLRISGEAVDDPTLTHTIPVYFCVVLAISVVAWLALVTFEPNSTWGVVESEVANQSLQGKELLKGTLDDKLVDCASAVATTLNNVGPGLGVVGTTRNFAGFSQGAKLLFVGLMMLGRVEIFSVLLLFVPSFWRRA